MEQRYILYNSINMRLNVRLQILQNDMFDKPEFCNLILITIPEF